MTLLKDKNIFSNLLFIMVDSKNEIRFINEAVENVWLFNKSDLIGKNLYEIIPQLKDIVQDENCLNIVTVNGILYHVIAFQVAKGNEQRFTLFLILDLNQIQQMKYELSTLKKNINELKEILEGSFDGILVTDAEGKVLFVNSSYERVAEISKKDLEGKKMEDLINPVWMPNSVAYVVAEQGQPVSKRQVVKSGRHIIVTGSPIFNSKGNVKKIVINARDITEIYEFTEELLKSKDDEKEYLYGHPNNQGESEEAIIATSQNMINIFTLAKKVAAFNTTVLILGESGVGKEIVAKYIHNNSLRKNKPFIVINCGAIPANLLESELFGYEKGAFTGAVNLGKEGLLESADGGTVFLDEIGETPLDFQVKILRFIESKELRRVGSLISKNVDVRIIAATNRDLLQMIEDGTFREDLYYRLNIVQIDVPPLRKRIDDIAPLASYFLRQANKTYNQNKLLTYDVIKELEKYPWIGNVRQLKNVIQNMVIISNNDYLQIDDLPWVMHQSINHTKRMIGMVFEKSNNISLTKATEELEKLILQKAKDTCKNTREIAEKIGINQSTVVRKLRKYNL